MKFDVEMWLVDRPKPYENNPRMISPEAIAKVAKSIKEYGFQQPIVVDEDDIILVGHTRLMAAQSLGVSEVPVHVASGLTASQKRGYRVADNRTGTESQWDYPLLKLELDTLNETDFDLGLTGFDPGELDKLLNFTLDADKEGDEDAVPEVPDVPVTVEGDLWVLGRHRLLCGDSTSVDAVDKLMNGTSVDLVFTDPPYNVAFNGRSGKHDVIKNDNLPEAEFDAFIAEVCGVITSVKPKAYYVWCNWSFYGTLQKLLPFKTCIVWAKNVFGMGAGYRHQHEFCLFNGKIDQVVKNESDLWSIAKDHAYMHPTQKPVELSVRAFGNHVKLLNVLDLFGGSGSTMIGAEQTGRNCYMMELDPKYCDVIVKRWQEFTGEKAYHETLKSQFDKISDERAVQTEAA